MNRTTRNLRLRYLNRALEVLGLFLFFSTIILTEFESLYSVLSFLKVLHDFPILCNKFKRYGVWEASAVEATEMICVS